jgi:hypothetical protein
MEQGNKQWASSLMRGLGVRSVAVPETNPSAKIKQFALAVSLAAVAAIASFAPSAAHAADAPSAAPITIDATLVTAGEDTQPQPAQAYDSETDMSIEIDLEGAQRKADNPFKAQYKIADRDRDFVDKLSDTIGVADAKADEVARNPISHSTSFKIFDAVTSPLDALVNATTDQGSVANDRAAKAAEIANVAIKYSTVGAGALISDGITGIKTGITKISESRDKEHAHVQSVMDAVRERQSRIYEQERERMAAEHSGSVAPDVANRADVEKSGAGGLETSNDGLDVLFKSEPGKAGKYDRDSTLSR